MSVPLLKSSHHIKKQIKRVTESAKKCIKHKLRQQITKQTTRNKTLALKFCVLLISFSLYISPAFPLKFHIKSCFYDLFFTVSLRYQFHFSPIFLFSFIVSFLFWPSSSYSKFFSYSKFLELGTIFWIWERFVWFYFNTTNQPWRSLSSLFS